MNKTLIQDHLLFPEILWKRPVAMYKYQAGKVFILAGSKGMAGAAVLTTEAAFRSGTGIIVLGFPESLKEVYKGVLPEAMTLTLPETPNGSISLKAKDLILESIKTSDAVAMGPGLSKNPETIQLVWELFPNIKKPLVLDADALNAISLGFKVIKTVKSSQDIAEIFKQIKTPIVITPHSQEMFRIVKAIKEKKEFSKINAQYIEDNKPQIASYVAKKLGIMVVLKGKDTVIADKDRVIINKTGGPALATAGTGDVLTGMITSFVAQNPKEILEAVATAVYLHGLAGDLAAKSLGERSVIASDIIKFIPKAIKQAEGEIE